MNDLQPAGEREEGKKKVHLPRTIQIETRAKRSDLRGRLAPQDDSKARQCPLDTPRSRAAHFAPPRIPGISPWTWHHYHHQT